MNNATRYMIALLLSLGGISILYFLCLIIAVPFIITIILSGTTVIFSYKIIGKNKEVDLPHKFMQLVLLVCISILVNKTYYFTTKYGLWDAWTIWDLHAQYLSDSDHWRNMFLSLYSAHPDYPLGLSDIQAFFHRLFLNKDVWIINHGIHFLITLLIPTIIYTETYKRGIFFSSLAMILIVTNDFFIIQGVSQLADTLLSLYFLCAIISINNYYNEPKMLAISAVFIGLCMWTKNEGVILAILFTVFHAKEIFNKKGIKLYLAGISLPILTWLLYKVVYAPTNDMVAGQSADTLSLLTDWSRYKMVYESFAKNYKEYFRDIRYGLLIYLLLIVLRRQWPDRQILMVVCICIVYMLIYIVSPHDLEWHLFTSQNRLMHQLMPSMMYLLVLRFTNRTGTNFRVRFSSTQ